MTIDPENGFHKGTLISCILSVIAQTINNCLILPSLPFLIQIYYPNIDISDIGYYSGYLISAYYLGQIPGCIFWGLCADQHGRKKTMITMNLLNFLCIFCFGISKNYYFSLIVRLIHGFVDGTLGVTKTIIAELSNSRNISLGTSFLFAGGGIGKLIAPFFSSYLTDKNVVAPLFPLLPFLRDMPFVLPFSIVSVICFCVVFSFICFSEDTLSPEEIATAKECKNQMKREMSGILRKNSLSSYDSHEQLLLQYHKYSSYSSILKDRDILLAVLLYFILTLVQMSVDSLVPSVLANRKNYGGFEMDITDISFITMSSSIITFCPMLLCPILAKLTKYKTQMFTSCIGLAISAFTYPLESLVNQSTFTIECMITTIFYSVFVLFRTVAFTVVIVITSNTCYKEFRATVMGLAQTIGGLGRFLGPTLFPTLYAWSCHVNVFPVNHGFVFFILGIIIVVAVVILPFLSPVCEKGRGSVTETIIHHNKSCCVCWKSSYHFSVNRGRDSGNFQTIQLVN